MYLIRDPNFPQLAEQVQCHTQDLVRLPEFEDLWRLPIALTPQKDIVKELLEKFYEQKSDDAINWARTQALRIEKKLFRGPQILWLKAGHLPIPEDQFWISIVLPRPNERAVGSAAGPQKATGRSEAYTALPLPQTQSRPNKPLIGSLSATSAALEVGDIILLHGKEKLQATDGGICMVTNVHLTSLDEVTGGGNEEQQAS